jgi:hypothetical protein
MGRVFADKRRFQVQDVPGQVWLVRLYLAVAINAFVSDYADDRVVADDRALEIDDLHREAAPVGAMWRGRPRLPNSVRKRGSEKMML